MELKTSALIKLILFCFAFNQSCWKKHYIFSYFCTRFKQSIFCHRYHSLVIIFIEISPFGAVNLLFYLGLKDLIAPPFLQIIYCSPPSLSILLIQISILISKIMKFHGTWMILRGGLRIWWSLKKTPKKLKLKKS